MDMLEPSIARTIPHPKLQVGMIDPHLNEKVTYMAEMDKETIKRQGWKSCFLHSVLSLFFGLCLPCAWFLVCVAYCVMKYLVKTRLRAQVYLTDHTFVYVEGSRGLRVTIPLASIATVVVVQPNVMIVNIKPTAPEVYHTRTVPIRDIRDAESFAKAIREQINYM